MFFRVAFPRQRMLAVVLLQERGVPVHRPGVPTKAQRPSSRAHTARRIAAAMPREFSDGRTELVPGTSSPWLNHCAGLVGEWR